MHSRYDYMTPGESYDTLIHDRYPDPLSLNYNTLKLSQRPYKDPMDRTKVTALWAECENAYMQPAYDDMLLSLNGVAHINLLSEDDVLYVPALTDIVQSFSN